MQRFSATGGARTAPGNRAWFLVVHGGAPGGRLGRRGRRRRPRSSRTDCFECHDGADGPTVDEKLFDQTVHADVECTDCHADVADVPHDAPLKKVDCSQCHDGVDAVYAKSIHGKLRAEGNKYVASCSSCHGVHNIFPPKDPRSQVYPLNLPETCGKCHGNLELIKKANIVTPAGGRRGRRPRDPYSRYKQSIHGQAVLKSGLVVSAVCNDCHGTHDILPHTDPASRINQANILKTCGGCHSGVLAQFDREHPRPGARRAARSSPRARARRPAPSATTRTASRASPPTTGSSTTSSSAAAATPTGSTPTARPTTGR